jgi:hypothetical protein
MSYDLRKNRAEQWHGIFSGIIYNNGDKQIIENEEKNELYFVADEITKLKNLLDEEVINQEEFEQQKIKLLS